MAETRLKEILAFVNHKGGVGKTTTVQSLATGLRRFGKGYFGKGADGKEQKPRILLVDLDPQVSLSFLFGWDQVNSDNKPTTYDALINQTSLPVYKMQEGIYLAPASQKMVSIEPFLAEAKKPLHLAYAIPDHPWIDSADGAAVRIAMTVGAPTTDLPEHLPHLGTVLSEQASQDKDSFAYDVKLDVRVVETLHEDLSAGANVAAAVAYRAEAGVVGRITDCKNGWCRIDVGGRRGWIETDHIWGD